MEHVKRLLILTAGCCAFVCLGGPKGAALGSAKEDDVPVEVPKPDADAVLRGLQWAFEPAPVAIRVQAIEDLGFLQDPRALNPLSALTLDANQLIAHAAVRAIAAIRHPRAEEILSTLTRHPTAPHATRALALQLLPFQNTATALRFVHQTARQTQGSYELVTLARKLAATLPQPHADSVLPQPATAPADFGDEK